MPPQVALRGLQIAACQRLAHRRAGNTDAALHDALHGLHRKAMLLADLFHQRVIAGPPAAEAEIVTDQHKLGDQPVMQGMDEIRRLHLRERAVKAAHLHAVHAQIGKQFRLFPQAGEPGRRRLRRKKFARMRLEHDHRRFQPARLRLLLEVLQQCTMAEVHAIEIADSER